MMIAENHRDPHLRRDDDEQDHKECDAPKLLPKKGSSG
jgi:hypothetical protein